MTYDAAVNLWRNILSLPEKTSLPSHFSQLCFFSLSKSFASGLPAFLRKYLINMKQNWSQIHIVNCSSVFHHMCYHFKNPALQNNANVDVCFVWAMRDEHSNMVVSLLMCLGASALSRIHAVSDGEWILVLRARNTGAALHRNYPETLSM